VHGAAVQQLASHSWVDDPPEDGDREVAAVADDDSVAAFAAFPEMAALPDEFWESGWECNLVFVAWT
jgi:hypothetical protein